MRRLWCGGVTSYKVMMHHDGQLFLSYRQVRAAPHARKKAPILRIGASECSDRTTMLILLRVAGCTHRYGRGGILNSQHVRPSLIPLSQREPVARKHASDA